MEVRRLLKAVVQFKASDLHVQAGSAPSLRMHGDITPLDFPAIAAEDVDDLVRQIADESTLEEIDQERSADFSYVDPVIGALPRQRVLREREQVLGVAAYSAGNATAGVVGITRSHQRYCRVRAWARVGDGDHG